MTDAWASLNDFEREVVALAVILLIMLMFDQGFIAGFAIIVFLASVTPLFSGAK